MDKNFEFRIMPLPRRCGQLTITLDYKFALAVEELYLSAQGLYIFITRWPEEFVTTQEGDL